MTTIKIPFTKKSIRQIPTKDLNRDTKLGIELEIQTNFHMSSLVSNLDKAVGGPITDAPFEKIALIFKDDGGQLIYDSLNENQNFELIFDKEKVWLNVFGFADIIDKTKPEVQVSSRSKSLVIFFETKFAGIITLESKDGKDTPKKDTPKKDTPKKDTPKKDNPNKDTPKKDNPNKDNPNKDNPNKDNPPNVSVVRNYCKSNDIKNLTYDEETDKLIIEYKQDKPTKELSDLSGELAEIKKYLLKKGKANGKKRSLVEADWEREYQNTQEQKTNYTPWLIGGGVLIFIIVILALVGMTKSNRD